MQEMINHNKALELVLNNTTVLNPEQTPIADANGMVMAEELISDKSYPLFDRSLMDGFAVYIEDAGKTVVVSDKVPAGKAPVTKIKKGFCAEIMTGAPCPPGTQAVVKQEDVIKKGDRITLPVTIKPYQHIAKKGSECDEKAVLAGKGDYVTPIIIANLATFGRQSVKVYPNPSIAIITTGSELAQPGEKLGPAQIRISNGPMLSAMAQNAGITNIRHNHAKDTQEELTLAFEKTVGADIIILTGGVSEGKYDLVPDTLSKIGARIIFRKVKQKPGKSMVFAKKVFAKKGPQLFFGLTGAPLGNHFCFHRYVTASICKMTGRSHMNEAFYGNLAAPLSIKTKAVFYMPARADRTGSKWLLTPLQGKGASDIFTPCSANAYIPFMGGSHSLAQGSQVKFEWIEGCK
jgi:molybdopterin molybdotransferase